MNAKKRLLIRQADIWPMDGDVLKETDILIENGKIANVGKDLKAENAEVIEAKGMLALPGIIDAHSHITTMSPTGDEQDSNEMTNATTPGVSIIHAFDPSSDDLKVALSCGITTVGLTPGSGNVIGGEAIAIKTYGTNPFKMVIKRPIALKCATGFNPKNVYGPRNERPMTRIAVAQIFRESLQKAVEYKKAKAEAKKEKKDPSPLILILKCSNRSLTVKFH